MRLDARPLRSAARRLGRGAPLLTLALLLTAPAVLAPRADDGAREARQKAIVAAMSDVPQRIGRWIGSDVPVPTEATEILRPNAILSRHYSELGGQKAFTVAIIHCTDVRDMNGHYPPICYGTNGWTLDEALNRSVAVPSTNGLEYPMRWYRFTRAERGGGMQVMTILNGFILPDGRLAPDMTALAALSRRRSASAQGVAQMQFVFDGDVAAERCIEIAKEFLDGLPTALLRHLGAPTTTAPVAATAPAHQGGT